MWNNQKNAIGIVALCALFCAAFFIIGSKSVNTEAIFEEGFIEGESYGYTQGYEQAIKEAYICSNPQFKEAVPVMEWAFEINLDCANTTNIVNEFAEEVFGDNGWR